MSWLDKLLEASEDQVDDVIDKAMGGDAEGVGDSSLADENVKDADVSDDPDKLTYDDDCYSQTTEEDEVKPAGTVDVELGDTETDVKAGAETAATESVEMTADELRLIYTESVAKVMLQEATKAQINAQYKKDVADAKSKKAKAIEKEKASKKAKKVAEAAGVNSMLEDIFSKF